MIARKSTIVANGLVLPILVTVEDYRSWLSSKGRSMKSVDDICSKLSRLFGELGIESPESMTADMIDQWVSSSLDRNVSPRSLKGFLKILRGFSKWLATSGMRSDDPWVDVITEVDDEDGEFGIDRIQVRMIRLFVVMEFVASCRIGATSQMIHDRQCECSKVCLRTTSRDLNLLVRVGILQKSKNPSNSMILYRTNPLSRLSVSLK